jgi:hypothetical protein
MSACSGYRTPFHQGLYDRPQFWHRRGHQRALAVDTGFGRQVRASCRRRSTYRQPHIWLNHAGFRHPGIPPPGVGWLFVLFAAQPGVEVRLVEGKRARLPTGRTLRLRHRYPALSPRPPFPRRRDEPAPRPVSLVRPRDHQPRREPRVRDSRPAPVPPRNPKWLNAFAHLALRSLLPGVPL